ncbi:hypothetical protein VTN77DRAFT_1850 [Rasamsonia byssochlamydoides]|uniref:uncharacterized protein n=1 Tax=Rasamsonia byssochlamydoides TaxID=89139 RepID=UPI0037435101
MLMQRRFSLCFFFHFFSVLYSCFLKWFLVWDDGVHVLALSVFSFMRGFLNGISFFFFFISDGFGDLNVCKGPMPRSRRTCSVEYAKHFVGQTRAVNLVASISSRARVDTRGKMCEGFMDLFFASRSGAPDVFSFRVPGPSSRDSGASRRSLFTSDASGKR